MRYLLLVVCVSCAGSDQKSAGADSAPEPAAPEVLTTDPSLPRASADPPPSSASSSSVTLPSVADPSQQLDYEAMAQALAEKGVRCPKGPGGGCTGCKPLGELVGDGDIRLLARSGPSARSAPSIPRSTAFKSKGPRCGPGGSCPGCQPPKGDDLKALFQEPPASP